MPRISRSASGCLASSLVPAAGYDSHKNMIYQNVNVTFIVTPRLFVRGVPLPFSLLNCLMSRFLWLESGRPWICAYSWARAVSVGFTASSFSDSALSVKLKTVFASLMLLSSCNTKIGLSSSPGRRFAPIPLKTEPQSLEKSP